MTAEQILVVILASALAVFLILGIVLTSCLIAFVRKLNSVADTAERTAMEFENFVGGLQRAVAPTAVSNLLMTVIDHFTYRRKKGKE